MESYLPVWDVLWWLVGLIGVWIVASILAYALLSVWLLLRAALARTSGALDGFARSVLSKHEATETRVELELRSRIRWYEVDAAAKTAWLETVDKMCVEARSNAAHTIAAVDLSSESLKLLSPAAKQLRGLALATETLPPIPDVKGIVDTSSKARVSVVVFVGASVLLLAIIFVNAQMTGLVLSEIVPPLQPFFGLPVPFVLAAGLVLMEAGIGLLHAVDAESREGTERSFTIGALIWSTAGVAVVLVEALLYSQVDSGAILAIPLAGSAFGLIGGLLGLAVFGLGRIWLSSLIAIRKSRTPKVVRKELEKLRYAAEEWNAVAERVRPQQEKAAHAFERLVQICREGTEIHVATVRNLGAELDRHRVDIPSWATAKERPMSESEFGERSSRTSLWLLIWVLSAAVLATLAGAFSIRVQPPEGMALGIGLAVGTLALGLFGAQSSGLGPNSRMLMQVLLGSAAVALAIVEARFLRGRVGWHAVALVAPAIASYVAGLKIGSDVALLRIPLLFLTRVVKLAGLYAAILALRLVDLLTLLVEYLLRVAAWPAWTLVELLRSRKANIRAEV